LEAFTVLPAEAVGVAAVDGVGSLGETVGKFEGVTVD